MPGTPVDRRVLLKRAAIGAGVGIAAPMIIGTHALALGSGPQPGGLPTVGGTVTTTFIVGPQFTVPAVNVSCTGGATPRLRYRFRIDTGNGANFSVDGVPVVFPGGNGTWSPFLPYANGTLREVTIPNSNGIQVSWSYIVQGVCDVAPLNANNGEDGWDCREVGPFSINRSGNSGNYNQIFVAPVVANTAQCVWPATS